MTQETVVVPDIGSDAGEVVELLVAPGDVVEEEQGLVVLESDKASMEIPSPAAGTVIELLAKVGDELGEGASVALIETVTGDASDDGEVGEASAGEARTPTGDAHGGDTSTSEAPEAQAAPAAGAGGGGDTGSGDEEIVVAVPAGKTTAHAAARGRGAASHQGREVYAGPAVRRLAREFGVPLGEVTGSGPRGRVLKEDLHGYVQRALDKPAGGAAIPEVPEVDFAAFGPVDVVERSRIDRMTADNMQRSWLNVPHVTQFDDADITELEAFRKSLADEASRRGTRMTPIPFLLKACAVALRHNEKINASLSDGGTTLTYKRYVHIGMAVDTPAGLVVPVLRDVDRKSLWELAEEVIDLAGRARERELKPAEMQGAGFTVSSLGAMGGRGFTPIVNTPEVAILGVGRAATQPAWDGTAFAPRLFMPLSLSYDHRVVNGGDAGRFLTELVQLLSDLRRLLL